MRKKVAIDGRAIQRQGRRGLKERQGDPPGWRDAALKPALPDSKRSFILTRRRGGRNVLPPSGLGWAGSTRPVEVTIYRDCDADAS